jgi:diguanylate cyclase (GGDEF)-like protein
MAPESSIIHKAPIARTLAEGFIGATLVFGIDLLISPQISVGIFYLFPVFRVAWKGNRKSAVAMCLLCSALWMIADFNSNRIYSSAIIGYWNAIVREERDALLLVGRTDSLTKLPNRLAFLEIAGRHSRLALRHKSALTVAYIDLDNFKLVNDTQGHGAGDELLRQVGQTLQHCVRTSDLVARLGGDEFAILLPDTQLPGAQIVVEKVRTTLMKGMKQNHWPVTFSIGCISFSRGATVDDMIRRADALMYEVKHGGKNTVNFAMTAGETCRVCTEVI